LSSNITVQSVILRDVLEESFDILGTARGILLDLLKEHGLDLDDKERKYSLDRIRKTIAQVFGEDVSDLILTRINEVSEKYGATKFAAQFIMPEVRFGEISARSKDMVRSIISLPLTPKQANYLHSAVSNMIADIENIDDARVKFGGRGEHYLHELRKNLPMLQEMLLEILAQENIIRQ
jgi:hypothetical protein